MKRSILIFLVIGTVMIFFGCSGDNPMAPKSNQSDLLAKELSQSDQAPTPLAKAKIGFTGTCNWVADGEPGEITVLPNGKTQVKGQTAEWYDAASDPRVTGQSFWYVNWLMEEEPNTAKIWGKSEMIVDGALGTWEISWHGWQTPTPSGFEIVCDAVGTGKEGEVKGLVAKWTYTMDIASGFFYATDGYIFEK